MNNPTTGQTESGAEDSFTIRSPSIALPSGGGAIRDVGEKFRANPVNGSAAISVPIFMSPGRAGFGPQLALSYDSAAGNGPFGLGWSLPLPAITRKTDKGLPQYRDFEESDVFIVGGAEDLVPFLVTAAGGQREHDSRLRTANGQEYRVARYRPRVEGPFALIERWTHQQTRATHWRIVTRDNVTTIFGADDTARIADPADPLRVFSWLISRMYDDKGNLVVYDYAAEDYAGIRRAAAHERNRDHDTRGPQQYLTRVRYGNLAPYLPSVASPQPAALPAEWMFELVFDYGDYADFGNPDAGVPPLSTKPWRVRPDPFSTYRAGFEIRTHRLCERVLMIHHFAELGDEPCLVRSTDLTYDRTGGDADPAAPTFSLLRRVRQTGFVRDDSTPGGYRRRETPPVDFTYSEPMIADRITEIDPAFLDNLPAGLMSPGYHWVDLDGEGLSGVLSEQGDAWFYKPNLGGGRFGPTTVVARKPSVAALGSSRQQILDLAGDGALEVVDFSGPLPGFQERTPDGNWTRFVPFASLPNIDWTDPALRFIDLTGDGFADALITEHDVFTWYRSQGEDGFAPAAHTRQPRDDERGPHLVFGDGTQTLFTADMSGDGLADLVRIRNGEVCYWPNLGYGRFGAKVTMDHAPLFDQPERYDPRRIRLADVDGSGPADIIYLGGADARLYMNRSGNALSDARVLPFPVPTDNLAAVHVADLLGNGTACLVWSSALPADSRRPVRYLDLIGGRKPFLLIGLKNNLGGETEVTYAPSTKFYLADKEAGRPWITRLPFPVHCVETVTAIDRWRKTRFTTTYSYHHGYFDGVEREFRGFGRVEVLDVQDHGVFAAANADSPYITPDQTLYQPPTKTIAWLHVGSATDLHHPLTQYQHEYFPNALAAVGSPAPLAPGFNEKPLTAIDLGVDELRPDEWREALRACKGLALREEIYELDVDALKPPPGVAPRHVPVRLFSAASHRFEIRRVQPKDRNRHGVFLVMEKEALTYQYELNLRSITQPAPAPAIIEPLEPDPRVAHSLNLSFDPYGNVLQTVAVGYGRARPYGGPGSAEDVALIQAVQAERLVSYRETRLTDEAIDPAIGTAPRAYYRLPLGCETQTYELTDIAPAPGTFYFSPERLRTFDVSDRYRPNGPLAPVARKAYHEQPKAGTATMRLVEHARTLFFQDDPTAAGFLSGRLPLGTLGRLGLVCAQYKLALTNPLLDAVFTAAQMNQATPAGGTVRADLRVPTRGGYLSGADFYPGVPANQLPPGVADEYWVSSGVAGFNIDAAQHFYLPERYEDPFTNMTTVSFDTRDLFVESSRDAEGHTTRVIRFDYRMLAPAEVEDINANRTEIYADLLGRVIAVAATGKGTEGDALAGYDDDLANPSAADLRDAFAPAPARDVLRRLLGNATTRFLYHFGESVDAAGQVTWETRPPGCCRIAREEHAADVARRRALDPTAESLMQVSFECSDGSGAVLMTRSQAEPETPGEPLRSIVGGKTICNNKGKPVKQYEPYFSHVASCRGEGDEHEEVGVTALMYYDAAGRLVRTELPDGSFTRVEFSPWHVATFDPNDTVVASRWYSTRNPPTPSAALPRDALGALLATPDQRAAWLAARHANTPALSILDSRGRAVIGIAHNRIEDAAGTFEHGGKRYRDERSLTFTKLDAEGTALWVRDARRNLVVQSILPAKATRWDDDPNEEAPAGSVPAYDMAGTRLYQCSMDAGDRWTLDDAAGKPMFRWDSREQWFASGYDNLHRPTTLHLIDAEHPAGLLVALTQYAGPTAADRQSNRCGREWRRFDQSGVVTNLAFDFKGNATRVARRLAIDYDAVTDWEIVRQLSPADEPDALLMDETFVQSTAFDALDRVVSQDAWHQAGESFAIHTPGYNERGLLTSQTLRIGATEFDRTAGTLTTAIASLSYDAKGQRQQLTLGNGVVTAYTYAPDTFRLLSLTSTRPSGSRLQDLRYTYDPIGNLTEIADAAVPTEFFANAAIEPVKRYEYDALYRLIEATGREHAGQMNIPPATNWNDCPFRVTFGANDAKTWRTYTQRFTFDAVGNLLVMQHAAPSNPSQGWTRQYEYATDSNRLLATGVGAPAVPTHYPAAAPTLSERYDYNGHGSMTALPHLPQMDWDHNEHLCRISRGPATASVDPDACPDSSLDAWYRYDASEQRVRKRVVKRGNLVEERLYLGAVEWYRRTQNGVVTEEIETVHLMDGGDRILMVDRVLRSLRGVSTLYRYTLANHLGASTVEVNENADVISFEEYHPYGTTAYQSGPNAAEVRLKRYRYSGMERDEESGFNYHTARYYAPAFSRWTSADPSGTRDGLNVFAFVGGNPVCAHDRGGHQAASSTATPPKTSAEANQLAQERYFKGDMAGYRAYSKVGHDLALSEAMAIAHKTRDEGSTIANGALFVMLAPLAATIVATAAIEAGIVLTAAEAASAATAVARGLWIASRGYIVGLFTGFKLTYEALVRNGGVSMSNISQAINVAGANAQIRTTAEVGANVLLSGDNPIDPVHGTAVAIEKKAATALEGAVAQDVKAVTQEVKAVAQDAKAATQQAVQVMHAADVLIGTSTTQMRRDAAALIRNTPGHKLSFLLDAAGNLKSSYGMSHAELIMRPDIVQMGHLVSNKSGLTERIVLQGGWENQFNALTAEKPRLGTYVENVAIVIGEIGVELKTAQFWESIGWLAPGTVKNAPRITYMP